MPEVTGAGVGLFVVHMVDGKIIKRVTGFHIKDGIVFLRMKGAIKWKYKQMWFPIEKLSFIEDEHYREDVQA